MKSLAEIKRRRVATKEAAKRPQLTNAELCVGSVVRLSLTALDDDSALRDHCYVHDLPVLRTRRNGDRMTVTVATKWEINATGGIDFESKQDVEDIARGLHMCGLAVHVWGDQSVGAFVVKHAKLCIVEESDRTSYFIPPVKSCDGAGADEINTLVFTRTPDKQWALESMFLLAQPFIADKIEWDGVHDRFDSMKFDYKFTLALESVTHRMPEVYETAFDAMANEGEKKCECCGS